MTNRNDQLRSVDRFGQPEHPALSGQTRSCSRER
jgi:hypothetical protein